MSEQPEQKAEKPKTLAQKISEIQGKVGVIHKKGKNKDQNYDYLRIEDAVVAVNQLMVEQHLLLSPTLQKRPDGLFYCESVRHDPKGYITNLVFDWTLEDTDTAEQRHFDIPGAGWDYNDKATPKAITSSRKQAIIVIFNLPVGNDIEERSSIDREDAKSKQKAVLEDQLRRSLTSTDEKIREKAKEGLASIGAPIPALFYVWHDESQTATVTGEKDLLSVHRKALKPFWNGNAQAIVMSAQELEDMKYYFQSKGVEFKQLQAANGA